jgi:hypothetical protein
MPIKYYGTQESLSKKEEFHFKKYRKKASFLKYKHFYIDPAIYTPVNLDCKHCHIVHASSCCENGQPYSMTVEAENLLKEHAPDIIKKYLDDERLADAMLHGYMEQITTNNTSTFNTVQSIKTCNGDCFFLQKSGKETYCSIHRYAEEKQVPPLEFKPFSCTLFPLDIIQYHNEILLTAITKETASFSRWGTQYNNYMCIDLDVRKKSDLADEYFTINSYKPAWEWNGSLLEHSFGSDLITFISEHDLFLNTL